MNKKVDTYFTVLLKNLWLRVELQIVVWLNLIVHMYVCKVCMFVRFVVMYVIGWM